MSMNGLAQQSTLDRLITQFGTFYFDERHHRMSLPLLARWMAADGRPEEALKLLQRFWRTGSDGVADRLLEATLRARLAGPAAALPALRRADRIDPTDPVLQRRLLQGLAEAGLADEARATAARLLRSARDPNVILAALTVADPEWQVFGVTDLDGAVVEGWCAWRGEEGERRCTVMADGRVAAFDVREEPHPVWNRAAVRFGRFRLAWPEGAAIVSVQDEATGRAMRGSPMMNEESLDAGSAPEPADIEVSVIVPVYADAKATLRCFESLAADRDTKTRRRILVVDDASPDPMIRALLDRLARRGQIVLLRNPQNVGFVRAVNRALRVVGHEDIVLLNADTMVPPGWLDRLRAAAQEPHVGTVTPLSNNGELVSVPAGFRPNPMPSAEQLREIDLDAQRLGRGIVEMPNGVGFCLYVRNEALRAVGGLDARHYERGYLEEVDFCLRIAAAGFRNVCATELVVAHQGEASFGSSKRELVMANASALVRRWPRIEEETGAFLRTDPLAPVRAALAWPSLPRGKRRRLIVAAPGSFDSGLAARLRVDAPHLEQAVLEAGGAAPTGWRVKLEGLDEPVPLPSDLQNAPAAQAFDALVDWLAVADIVVAPGASLPPELPALAARAGEAFDLLPVDAGWMADPSVVAAARRVLWTTSSLREAQTRSFPAVEPVPLPAPPMRDLAPAGLSGDAMGILPADASPRTFALIRDLARALQRRGSSRALIVFGATFRDVGLLRIGNVFVTGPLREEDDWREAFAAHPCGGLMLTVRQPLYVHGSLDVVRSLDLPFAAYRAGGAGDLLDEKPNGLALDPDWTPDQLALVIDTFLSATILAGVKKSLAESA